MVDISDTVVRIVAGLIIIFFDPGFEKKEEKVTKVHQTSNQTYQRQTAKEPFLRKRQHEIRKAC